jgi:hypothetical protein
LIGCIVVGKSITVARPNQHIELATPWSLHVATLPETRIFNATLSYLNARTDHNAIKHNE